MSQDSRSNSAEVADLRTGSPLGRTISVDSIASLFRKRKRADSESATPTPVESPHDSDTTESDKEGTRDTKRRKVKTKEEIEFEENEKKLDAELPEELRKYRPLGFKFNIPPKDRPIRIYADGVFDLFHLGHMKQLEQAKKAFPNVALVCGIPSDVETHKRKGLTVLTDQQRIETLQHCRWVDEVIPNAPWCVTTEFLLQHKIDYVAHDDLPYASTDSDDIYKPIKEMGMFLTTQRTEGISTSDIITKIIRDYDKYLMRNFARGATREELNVSWLKKNELEFKKHINDFRSYWTKNKTNINNVSKDLYFEVREYIRGKKTGSSSSSDNNSITSEFDEVNSRANSPLTDFASKYIGNANKDLNGKSILANVKGWIKGDELSANEKSEPSSESLSRKSTRSSTRSSKLNNNKSSASSVSSSKSPKMTSKSVTSTPKNSKKINKRTQKSS
ncbi:DEHA2G21560p [Debaryomyces hansenii CBS767]|uniref:choline-phosphate cytidylyltransferase n=1 Tax=Debaryomyces hansenii (strain ATCC 36239 / CBS 767 / BCRC 21394 / JCM 1990 / NBRC 0083 / IGC 2968) TaxID=284592 RepID=Q6BH41_DEBHA|nr:DEHA2G21560p [Debaryomyces hansenii CBS767]CAG90990.2 DEHA2G21560p [Debaryomyces hansenii CBS767]|eukprot:XP_462480.2 DEHA2G21560p [Debaryomyces hansenii CBS767]